MKATNVFLIACLALMGVGLTFADNNAPKEPTLKSADTAGLESFTQPKTLEELLALPPDQLEKIDIALINLLCAEGLAGSEDLDLDTFLRTLDQWAVYVERETSRNYHLFEEQPEKFGNSLAYFRMSMLATVLVQDVRIRYSPEREEQLVNGHILRTVEDEKTFFADSKDVFIHGLLTGKHYGTCASLPFLYVAIGRRLGYPVTLAMTSTHFYVRYEEGNGKHLNVEATEHRAFLTPSDEEYRNPWEMSLSDAEVNGMRYLQPMSNKEILGHSLLTRSAVLRSMKEYDKQAETWAIAARYLPDTPTWKGIVHDMQLAAKSEGEREKRDALWDRVARLYVPRGPGYAYFQDKKVRLHLLMNYSMNMTAVENAVEDFENELREHMMPFIEPDSNRIIQLHDEQQPRLVFRYTAASGKEVRIPADFLPPFEGGMIPLELAQRLADKGLEDEESILSECWAFYDEIMQKRYVSTQDAARQRIIQNGTGPIFIARERVPQEYWDSIPGQLQLRLSGLRNGEDIVSEMWAFHREEAVQRQNEQQRARMLAREQALQVLRRRGLPLSRTFGGPQPPASFLPQPPGAAENPIPSMYREWITPDLAARLSPEDIRSLQQNERNFENMQQGEELRRQSSATDSFMPMNFQIVPGADLGGGTAAHPQAPNLPLTPRPQPLQ